MTSRDVGYGSWEALRQRVVSTIDSGFMPIHCHRVCVDPGFSSKAILQVETELCRVHQLGTVHVTG